jgi:acyl-CoA synthetase (AMP-forming)/AMP-acid ligase II
MTDPAKLAAVREALIGPGGAYELAEEEVRGERMQVFVHRAKSLSELLERSARFGDREFLVEGDRRIGYREHLELVRRAAALLRSEFGVRPGERVAIFAANRWEWLVAFWAATWLGAIPAAMNGWWTPEEFAAAAALVDPALVIGDTARLARVSRELGGIRTLNFDDGFEPMLREVPEPLPAAQPVREDDPAVLIFTSGTTGRAKAVTVPHRAVAGFVQVSAFSIAFGSAIAGAPLPLPGALPPPIDEVILVTSPLFHVSMLYGSVVLGLVKGSRLVLLPGRFDPERVLAAIEGERVNQWSALGSAATRVVTSAGIRTRDTSSVRQLGIGGAPVSPAVQAALREAFPSARRSIGMGYTSTEGGAVVASIGGEELVKHPTSTGRITLTVEVELRDAEGKRVPDGQPGEVHVRSPYLMLGYWNDPEASAKVLLPGGWLAMGDVARFENGLLYIDARARDMILVNAENVSPTEVEYRLEAHPQVIEAAVLAVDDPLTGDAVCAVVVVAPGSAPSSEELDAWCRQSLAHYKVPTRWIVTNEALPRTPSGKVVKREVRERIGA